MKAIFLDIDGVLNNSNYTMMLVNELLGKEQYFQLLRDLGEMPFDYRSCMLLQKLIDETGARVVLSSTWRLSEKHINGIIRYAGIAIFDKTPRLGTIRGNEIQQYLNSHPEIDRYVIVDDDSDMLDEQMDNFIECDAEVGFTYEEYERAKKILER